MQQLNSCNNGSASDSSLLGCSGQHASRLLIARAACCYSTCESVTDLSVSISSCLSKTATIQGGYTPTPGRAACQLAAMPQQCCINQELQVHCCTAAGKCPAAQRLRSSQAAQGCRCLLPPAACQQRDAVSSSLQQQPASNRTPSATALSNRAPSATACQQQPSATGRRQQEPGVGTGLAQSSWSSGTQYELAADRRAAHHFKY